MLGAGIIAKLKQEWKENPLGSALAALFVCAAFFSALNKVRDTETWLHLSLGRLIWQTKGVPDVEMFTYPNLGAPFSYNSWLFGLLTYALEANFGVYALGLLKAVVISTAFYILLKDALRPHKNYAIAVAVMTAVLLLSYHRFVLRPDMFLMVFLGFSIFSLNAYLYEGKKYLYALPAIHLLWANMHASIILIFVPFGAFIVGSLIQRYLENRGFGAKNSLSNAQIKIVAIIFAASFIATLITPYLSLHQYIYGPKYVTSGWHTEYIQEMLPPAGVDRTILYIVIATVSASFALLGRRISIIHLLLVLPFMYLPFVSVRFKFLLAITAGPVLARNISAFIASRKWDEFFRKKPMYIASACCIALYIALSVARIGPFWIPASFGFGFDYSEMPKGAVEYMDKKGIYGKMLNSFHFGQYITWTGYPKRQAFIDARGHLPADLLEKVQNFPSADFILDDLYRTYGFQSILMELGEGDRPYSPPGWALVYWDDISLLYLKKGGTYDQIISEDEYRYVKPSVGFGHFLEYSNDKAAAISELKRNINETGSSRARVLLGLMYESIGFHKEAIGVLSKVTRQYPSLKYAAYISIGDAFKNMGDIDNSIIYYKKAFAIKDNPAVLYKVALSYEKKGDKRETVKYLKKALSMRDDLLYAYPVLIDTYLALGERGKAEEAEKEFMKVRAKVAVKMLLQDGKTAFLDKNYTAAIEAFGKAIEADASNAQAYASLGYVYFDMGQDMEAFKYLSKALELDPKKANAKELSFPNAHFGLAMIYRKTGDDRKTREHLENFLDIEPSGHFSRKAETMLEEMSREGR